MGRAVLPGDISAPALVLDHPLSMWGGLDPVTGKIIDRRHPQEGESVTGRVLVLPHGRGSSSASSILAEAIRLGTAPAAVVLGEPDDIVLLGAIAAEEIYGITCPVVVATAEEYEAIATGNVVSITSDGTISSQ